MINTMRRIVDTLMMGGPVEQELSFTFRQEPGADAAPGPGVSNLLRGFRRHFVFHVLHSLHTFGDIHRFGLLILGVDKSA